MGKTDVGASTATVLVIDDDTDFTTAVRAVLEGEGYRVVTAASGQEGLRRLRESPPDLIILDVMMESVTEGYGVNEAIKYSGEYEQYQQTPIVMVSSVQESPDQLFPRAPETDMIRPDRYLTKPLDIPVFLEVVRRALGR
jgi:two-component system, OmpR family, alkaline phosphatase synthesis response regulator PhoP